jgi:hypothetical protein
VPTIKDTDKGYKKTLNNAADMKKAGVDVGIFASDGAEAKKGSPDLTLIEVAVFNEFGLGVPERSFIRGYVDEKENETKELVRKLAERILAGKMTKDQALDLLGLKVQGGMQKRIADGIEPANAPSTIARKGSSTPLIDTGQLRSSITYKVRK